MRARVLQGRSTDVGADERSRKAKIRAQLRSEIPAYGDFMMPTSGLFPALTRSLVDGDYRDALDNARAIAEHANKLNKEVQAWVSKRATPEPEPKTKK